jgi:hypothetical protein
MFLMSGIGMLDLAHRNLAQLQLKGGRPEPPLPATTQCSPCRCQLAA